jgi:hypothetical protein
VDARELDGDHAPSSLANVGRSQGENDIHTLAIILSCHSLISFLRRVDEDETAPIKAKLGKVSERKKVGDKMLHVMNQRKEKKEEIQRAVDRESKKRKLPDQAMPGRKAKKNDEYTKENKIFFTALEHGQPLPLFRGKYAGPNFTRAEMKSIGFQCYHEIKGGTVYIIPRHAWHSVFNSKANCFSYAWDCMYKMFASEQTSNSE